MSYPAEENGPFIVHMLEKISSFEPSRVTQQNASTIGSSLAGGLYMFYLVPTPTPMGYDDRYCPIYVGMTGRTFRKRFQEHAANGVIADFFTPGRIMPTNPCNLYVAGFNFNAPAAKLLESIFLSAFDFARNTEENGAARNNVTLTADRELSYSRGPFVEAFERVMLDVGTIGQSVKTALDL